MYFFLSNFSLQNYKIGPKKTQNYLPKLEIQTEQNLKKTFVYKSFWPGICQILLCEK